MTGGRRSMPLAGRLAEAGTTPARGRTIGTAVIGAWLGVPCDGASTAGSRSISDSALVPLLVGARSTWATGAACCVTGATCGALRWARDMSLGLTIGAGTAATRVGAGRDDGRALAVASGAGDRAGEDSAVVDFVTGTLSSGGRLVRVNFGGVVAAA